MDRCPLMVMGEGWDGTSVSAWGSMRETVRGPSTSPASVSATCAAGSPAAPDGTSRTAKGQSREQRGGHTSQKRKLCNYTYINI